MSDVPVNNSSRRLPWLAALLSFIAVGLGQVYAGRLVRGLIFSLVSGLAISASIVFLAYLGPMPTLPFGLFAIVAALGLTMVAAIDAYRVAARTRPDYELKAYNRPVVYLLLGLLVMGSSIGYSLHIRSSLFEAFRVPAASMYPTIGINDRILVDKTAYRRADPQRGDIVVFHPPTGNWRDHYIKRIIAVGGDTVAMRNGDLYVNGQPLSPLATGAPPNQPDFGEITIPAHYGFVLGDNRSESLDSRQFGPIPYATIIGRADYIYWPARDWSRFGRLD